MVKKTNTVTHIIVLLLHIIISLFLGYDVVGSITGDGMFLVLLARFIIVLAYFIVLLKRKEKIKHSIIVYIIEVIIIGIIYVTVFAPMEGGFFAGFGSVVNALFIAVELITILIINFIVFMIDRVKGKKHGLN